VDIRYICVPLWNKTSRCRGGKFVDLSSVTTGFLCGATQVWSFGTRGLPTKIHNLKKKMVKQPVSSKLCETDLYSFVNFPVGTLNPGYSSYAFLIATFPKPHIDTFHAQNRIE
jgi:hypothetical protein